MQMGFESGVEEMGERTARRETSKLVSQLKKTRLNKICQSLNPKAEMAQKDATCLDLWLEMAKETQKASHIKRSQPKNTTKVQKVLRAKDPMKHSHR